MLNRLTTLALVLSALPLAAQTAVPVGAGSYASYPPASAGATASATATQSLYVVSGNVLPVPSNKWWTDLVINQYCGILYAHPLAVSADAQGVNIFEPEWGVYDGAHAFVDQNFQAAWPISVRGQSFAPADARALRWGDWTVSFRMQESAGKLVDVTLGHGLPYVWMQFTGVAPIITSDLSTTYFQDDGSPQTFPVTTNRFGITYAGRNYGVFAPDNTLFTLSGSNVLVTFASTNTYLVVGALPANTNLAYFHQYAFVLPTNSTMDWSYSPAGGAVTTKWHLATQVLQGTETNVLQGWIPHHYRSTSNNLVFNGINYSSVRGPMKCATGTDFEIVYPFSGLLPTLPAPTTTGRSNDYDATRMNSYITGVAATSGIAAETYGGGQDMLRYAQHMVFAQLLGRPETNTLANTARSAMVDWFTYSSGGDGKYFAYYPSWKALTGFPASYGSDQFNDHHFHYGYFTHVAALLGMYDQTFLNQYGPMAKMVAKEYANWDRSDTNFPFLRTLDIWSGHSDASGFSSSAKGNNQESSSEAMQSWGGLFLLGAMLGDDQMRAAGAMGYAMEAEGVRQYWFNFSKFYNPNDSNWPASYTKPCVGILWDDGQEYQTYFGASALYVHGIQWVPQTELLGYLFKDPAFAQQDYNDMITQRGDSSLSTMGSQWGNYALSYLGQFNPDYVAAQLDQLWANNDPVATDRTYAGVTYYLTHSMRNLGAIQWQFHMDVPTSAVYYNALSGKYSYVAFNPQGVSQAATIYSNNIAVGGLVLPPHALVNQTYLGTNPPAPITNVIGPVVRDGFALAWLAAAGTNYAPQWATALDTNTAWSNLTATVTGDGVTNYVFDPLDTNVSRFYRVLQLP